MLSFVQGLPQGVYVGQTKIHDLQPIEIDNHHLKGFNLALHVQDNPQRVHLHRMQLLRYFAPYHVKQLTWCNQTHSTICHRVDGQMNMTALTGDALITSDLGHGLMIMTADCLAIVLGDEQATEIANLHAGWRGLANGMIEQTLAKMYTQATWAWLGCAISQKYFEVGVDVKKQFIEHYGDDVEPYFKPASQVDKYLADLYAIARYILQKNGVKQVLGGDQCSYSQSDDYYSYRRHAKTGRMATFVFLSYDN